MSQAPLPTDLVTRLRTQYPKFCPLPMDASLLMEEAAAKLELYEQAIKEAEAILGGEYANHYGSFYDLVEKARG